MQTLSGQLPKTLLTLSTPQVKDGRMSIYTGELTLRSLLEMNKKIKDAFPELPASWFDVFNERVKANRFTDQRLRDAVNHVIDNFTYGRIPNVGHFISYDRLIDLLTPGELDKLAINDRSIYRDYGSIEVAGSIMYAKITDIRKYRLTLHEPEEMKSSDWDYPEGWFDEK